MIICTFLALCKLCGLGIPCVIIVDSNATTGSLLAMALLTWSDITIDFVENLCLDKFKTVFLVQNIIFSKTSKIKHFFFQNFQNLFTEKQHSYSFQFSSVCQIFGVIIKFWALFVFNDLNKAENQNKNKNTCSSRFLSKKNWEKLQNAIRHRCKTV